MAPAGPGAALVGPGRSEVGTLLAWDSPEAAALSTSDAELLPALADSLATCAAALVFSRAATLASRLEGLIPRVVAHDPQPPSGAGHASDWFASALEQLDVPRPRELAPSIAPTPEETAAANAHVRGLPAGFLAVHAGSGSPAKNAPADRLAAFVAERSPASPFALIEGPADAVATARLRALAPHAFVLRGLPLRVLGAVLARCGLYLGSDSGVSHLAAACGAPCHVFFGPTDPGVWAPLGERVSVERFD